MNKHFIKSSLGLQEQGYKPCTTYIKRKEVWTDNIENQT